MRWPPVWLAMALLFRSVPCERSPYFTFQEMRAILPWTYRVRMAIRMRHPRPKLKITRRQLLAQGSPGWQK